MRGILISILCAVPTALLVYYFFVRYLGTSPELEAAASALILLVIQPIKEGIEESDWRDRTLDQLDRQPDTPRHWLMSAIYTLGSAITLYVLIILASILGGFATAFFGGGVFQAWIQAEPSAFFLASDLVAFPLTFGLLTLFFRTLCIVRAVPKFSDAVFVYLLGWTIATDFHPGSSWLMSETTNTFPGLIPPELIGVGDAQNFLSGFVSLCVSLIIYLPSLILGFFMGKDRVYRTRAEELFDLLDDSTRKAISDLIHEEVNSSRKQE